MHALSTDDRGPSIEQSTTASSKDGVDTRHRATPVIKSHIESNTMIKVT